MHRQNVVLLKPAPLAISFDKRPGPKKIDRIPFLLHMSIIFLFSAISSALPVPLQSNPVYSPEAAKRFLLAQGNKKE